MKGNGDGRENIKITVCPPDPRLTNWPLPPDSDVPIKLSDYFMCRRFYAAFVQNDYRSHSKMVIGHNCFWNRKAATGP